MTPKRRVIKKHGWAQNNEQALTAKKNLEDIFVHLQCYHRHHYYHYHQHYQYYHYHEPQTKYTCLPIPPAATIGEGELVTFPIVSCCSCLKDTDTPTAGSESSTAPEDWRLRPGAINGNSPSITVGDAKFCCSLRRP